MKAWDFFESVFLNELMPTDIHNKIKSLTDNYDEVKLILLCDDFDKYYYVKVNELLSSLDIKQVEERLKCIRNSEGKINSVQNSSIQKSISAYFQQDERQLKLNTYRLLHFSKSRNNPFPEKLNKYRFVDLKSIFFLSETIPLEELKFTLINLRAKHTSSVLKDEYKKESETYKSSTVKPIHWLNGEESLRQFIEDLKRAGMIEKRETEDIIQEHFEVDGKKPVNQPKPIVWTGTKVLLAHLISGLDDILEIRHIWKTITPHFHWKGKVPTGLRQSAGSNPYPNNIAKIEGILRSIKERK